MAPAPDNNAAVDFLKRWRQGGPWVVTAIRPDRKAINTQTFDKGSIPALRRWLEEHNGKFNIYFHVNPTLKPMEKKAEREDIASVDWLHIDVDPRVGEDLDDERARALALLTNNLPEGVPPPTVVVFSGGGYQGFWRLTDPIPIDGDLAKAEAAKLYNLQLEVLFRADNCHNIDRIMRLPGTINIPDARKLKKGRTEELARVVEFNDLAYPLTFFKPAPRLQMPGGEDGGQESVKISGNIDRVQDLSELDEWNVPNRVRVIIGQGTDPDEPQRHPSRSEWLFDVVCNLVRCEVPDDVIYSIITDQGWPISSSVLEKGSNSHKYAVRQIEKAKEQAIDPLLRRLNEQHFVLGNIGGKCMVSEEVRDVTLDRYRLTFQSFDAFRNRYMNQYVVVGQDKEGNPVEQPAGKWWLSHPKRRQYNTLIFAPEKDVQGCYNLWKGFAVQSIPGDCSLFLAHLHDNICSGQEELHEYLLNWMARMVQHPDTPGEVAVVLRGGRGTGKSFFATHLGKLLGRHFLHVSNSSHLTGNFNNHLRDLVLLFADEAFYAGDKRHASILKTLITETTLTIEAKGIDVESAPNYIHLIMASNDMHVVPAGGDERRYFVLDVGKDHQQDHSYFKRIADQLKSGGYEALLHILRSRDLSNFHVQDVPQTRALREQKLLSLDVEHEWWFHKLHDGQLLERESGWPTEVMKDLLVADYVENARQFNITRRGSQTSLGRFLQRVCPSLGHSRKRVKIDVPANDGWVRTMERVKQHYILPTLQECRAHWIASHGQQDWPPAEAQGELDVVEAQKSPF